MMRELLDADEAGDRNDGTTNATPAKAGVQAMCIASVVVT